MELNNSNMEKKKKNRRNFVRDGLRLSAGIIVGTESLISEEKVKVLTADGKVVEINRSSIGQAKGKTKNEDILNWMDNPGVKK